MNRMNMINSLYGSGEGRIREEDFRRSGVEGWNSPHPCIIL